MRSHSIIRTLAATALIALPSIAMAAPDQNTNNGCPNGQWRNSQNQCVGNGNNGQWNNGRNNNGQWNNGRHRDRDRDRDDRDDRSRGDNDRDDHGNRGQHRGWDNGRGNPHGNGGYNNGGYNNGGYNNGGYGNRSGQLSGQVSSFSAYNLYLSNGTHVVLHNGTVINPTGTNLTSGQRVRVVGTWNQDGTFNANEVDVVSTGYGNYRR